MKQISPLRQIQLIEDFARNSKNRAMKELIYRLLSLCPNDTTNKTNHDTTMIVISNTGRAYRVIEDFRAEFYYTEDYDMIYAKEKPIIYFHFFSLYGNMGSFEFYATDIESVEKIQTNTFTVKLNKHYKHNALHIGTNFFEIVDASSDEAASDVASSNSEIIDRNFHLQQKSELELKKIEITEKCDTWFTIQFKEKTI